MNIKWAIAIWVVYLICILIGLIGIVYVAVHFITKFW